tara:strand:+ start:4371 stop:4592 length:222 start_codon:yes stop_codon:yes gene_type:complete
MPKKLSIITERDKLRARRKLIPRWRPGATGAVEDYVFLRRKIPRTPKKTKIAVSLASHGLQIGINLAIPLHFP